MLTRRIVLALALAILGNGAPVYSQQKAAQPLILKENAIRALKLAPAG